MTRASAPARRGPRAPCASRSTTPASASRPRRQGRLFEPFTQADALHDAEATAARASASRSRKQLVELMGGAIGVESAAGRGHARSGSTVRAASPATKRRAAAGAAPARCDGRARAGGRRQRHQPAHLRAPGHRAGAREVELAQDGARGLAALRAAAERGAARTEVVLVDYSMPGMDGFGFARAVRADADAGAACSSCF